MGLSSSSSAGASVTRAQLEEAIRAADAARVKAEAAQAAAMAQLASFESSVSLEPAPTKGQAAVKRSEARARSLPPGGGAARDRSRSARALQQAERIKPQLTARAKTPSVAPAPPWASPVPGPPTGMAPPIAPKARHPPGKARMLPIGAPPPAAADPGEDYELVEDDSPVAAPKAELRPARPQQAPIGAPPPHAPDLELDDDAAGVGTTYPRRGWRIPRNSQGEIALDDVRPDIDSTAEDLANGYTEVEALRRLRDRTRAARHNAMKWHTWQVERGIVPPEAGARLPAATEAPPPYRGSAPAEAKGPGGKGVPPARSRTPGQAKGSGGKGRGSGSQPAGKGGKKGAHPGRGEYSRYAGYSGAASGSGPSAQFRDSVPAGQAKGAPPKGTPFAAEGTGDLGSPAPAPEYVPSYLSGLNPEELAEARKQAEAFNAFLDAFPSGSRPVIPEPAPSLAAGKAPSPMVAYSGLGAPAPPQSPVLRWRRAIPLMPSHWTRVPLRPERPRRK